MQKKNKKSNDKGKTWLKLDNAANIYPSLISRNFTPNFRVSLTLTEPVNPELLQKATENCLPRFENFSSTLKKGLFWHYLEHNDNSPVVEYDSHFPMRPLISKYNNGFHFRVCYYENRIALEVMHVITDGTGATYFLCTLVAEYLRLTGKKIPYSGPGIIDLTAKPVPEEMEDSFRKYTRFKARRTRKEASAYHIKGTKLPHGEVGIITGRVPVAAVKEKAKQFNATITEYLTAVLVWSLYLHQKEHSKKEVAIKVTIPINLRNHYPSKTLRNFSLFINPGIEPKYGDWDFDEIVSDVQHFLRLNNKEKFLNANMSANLGDEINPFIRAVPLFLKTPVLHMYFVSGEDKYSSTISNLGEFKMPEEMKPYIERADFILGRPYIMPTNCAVASFNGIMSISFGRSIKEKDCERVFFNTLVKMGIPVKIESNQ